MKNMDILSTERLLLRLFAIADLDDLQAVLGDTEVMRFSLGVLDTEGIKAWLTYHIHGYTEHRNLGPWAVLRRVDSILIGYCGLFFLPDVCNQPEIELGYRFAQAYWGQGYATEAARAVCDFAFSFRNINRLVSLIDPANRASIKVAEKVGMHFEKEVMLADYDYPDHLYAIQRTPGELQVSLYSGSIPLAIS